MAGNLDRIGTEVIADRIQLPAFGRADAAPEIAASVYTARISMALQRMRESKLDFLLVYADREHFANLAYLTGFDPRFEEALLLLSCEGRGKLLVGNECMGYLPDPALGLETELFQEFSLLGQSRDASRPLRTIVTDFGIHAGSVTGCVGWKYFDSRLVDCGGDAVDIPSYIVDTLRDVCATVRNATRLFMDPGDGLRTVNEPEQIAFFEYAGSVTSDAVLDLIRNLGENVPECDLQRYLNSRGLPLSCHPMISFGAKARRGLSSPSANRARTGDPYTVAFGVHGGLTCRAGCVAKGPGNLPGDTREFYPRYAENYFRVVAAWYAAVKVGAEGREVFTAVERARDKALFSFAVNPGHLIHLDEWVHSPFAPNSDVCLRSGMALQMDIIPVSNGPFCCVNAEDGIVLADAALRASVERQYPKCYARMVERRRFMREVIGIPVDESVLPLSNIPAWLPPYALEPDVVFTCR